MGGFAHQPVLDGLRSVAVYLVLLFHAGLGAFGGGFIGVDLFFVLSGFLVSNVILSEIDATGRLDVGRFYARRVRRLLPAAVLVIVATSLVVVLVKPLVRRIPLVEDAQSALVYVANWNFLSKQEDYFAAYVDESPFLHFWSLAIEEQFYLLLPVLLVLLVRLSRRHRWVLPTVLALLFAASLTSQLVWARLDTTWAYYGTDARFYQLLAGVLLAITLRKVETSHRVLPNLAALVGLVGLVVLATSALDLTPSQRGLGATAASVALLGGLVLAGTGPLVWLFTRPVPVYLGQVSYGTYLWHWPVILVVGELLEIGPFRLALLAGGIATALAALSSQVLELPIRTSTYLHRFRWRVVLTGLATSALVAAAVVPVVLQDSSRPSLVVAALPVAPAPVPAEDGAADEPSQASTPASVSSQALVRNRNAPIPADIDWEKLARHTGDYPTCTEQHPNACVIVEGDGPHVLLFGDSHAKVLVDMFTRLAKEQDFKFSVNVQPGCPWQLGLVDLDLSAARRAQCRSRRAPWVRHVLPVLDPDLVVLSGMARDDAEWWRDRLVREDATQQPLAQMLFSSTQETARTISAQGRRVLMLNSMPVMRGADPVECLAMARRVYQCEFELPPPTPSDAYNEATAALVDNAYAVDIADAFCIGAPRCLPVVGRTVVWKDSLHFTSDFAVRERGEIWARIRMSGALDGL